MTVLAAPPVGDGPADPVAAARAKLAAGLDAVAALDAASLRTDDLLGLTRDLVGAGARVAAARSATLAVLDERGEWLDQGCLTATAWLDATTPLDLGLSRETTRVARNLRHAPLTADALGDGSLSEAAAALIASYARRDPAAFAPVEASIVAAAKVVTRRQLKALLERWRDAIDTSDPTQDDADRSHRRRGLHLSQTLEGEWYLRGRFDAVTGARIAAAITAVEQHLFHNRDGLLPAQDRPAADQRRLDALAELIDAGAEHLAGCDGDHTKVPACANAVTVVVRAEDLGTDRTATVDIDGEPITLPCQSLTHLLCDCRQTTIAVRDLNDPIAVGRAFRRATPAIRKALAVRDAGCAVPGCCRPPRHCDAHHITSWAAGGATRLDNMVLLCRRHHRLLHTQAWQIRIDNGRPVISIDGTDLIDPRRTQP